MLAPLGVPLLGAHLWGAGRRGEHLHAGHARPTRGAPAARALSLRNRTPRGKLWTRCVGKRVARPCT